MNAPEPARKQALQQRIADAIVEAAARTFARGGDRASMHDVATEAGVARATLYRYFPSRQALVQEVGRLAASDAGTRLRSARLGEIPVEEGVARAVRALVEVGDLFIVLARERVRPDPDVFESSLGAPLRSLVERGQEMGSIRDDVPSSWLTESLLGLVVSVLSVSPSMGREDTTAITTSLFLDGALRPRSEVE
jgi:TetR/AcrR family transcriptional regulator, mexCD-oprJ operon repressor